MRTWIVSFMIPLCGCAGQSTRTYADDWLSQPPPVSQNQKTMECRNLRAAIAQEQGAGNAARGAVMANPMLVIGVQNEANRRIAVLETRASEIGCYEPVTAPAPAAESDLDRLSKLNDLRRTGAITEEEYQREKNKLLGVR